MPGAGRHRSKHRAARRAGCAASTGAGWSGACQRPRERAALYSAFWVFLGAFSLGAFFSLAFFGPLRSAFSPVIHSLVPSSLSVGGATGFGGLRCSCHLRYRFM